MRNAFCQALVEAASRPEFVFLTGDLGFKALEPLRDAMGSRFINAGVAEQNMVSVAAGLARSGMRPWVYSIAPFVYARPFEQIRNDVCLHKLPVVLVGNGGGYGYGVMGATHHALEDYGALLCLPHMRAYVPAFDADVRAMTSDLFSVGHPSYLRLGLSEEPKDATVPPYAPWRKLQAGPGWVILVTGSLAGSLWGAVRDLDRGQSARALAAQRASRTTTLRGIPGRPGSIAAPPRRRGACRARRSGPEPGDAAPGVGQGPGAVRLPVGPGLSLGPVRIAEVSSPRMRPRLRLHPRLSRHPGYLEMPDPSPRPPSPIAEKIRRLQGPILVLGASGFVGANLMRTIFDLRQDVFGTTTRTPAWRLEDLPAENVRTVDLLIDSNLDTLLDSIRPRTIFNCVAYGAYSFETDSQLIYRTNFQFITRLLPRLEARSIACYVHAGSSSEYGDNAAGPCEQAPTAPNSDYAVSKIATANLIYYYGKRKRFPCANLRLYSVFGPLEDSSRLIPNLIRHGLEGGYPGFVNPAVSRDFVYVDDVTEAFVDTALNLASADYGESFNIGTGRKTTIGEVAATARKLFNIPTEPAFTMPERQWDVQDWYANIDKAREHLGWEPRTTFEHGLAGDHRLVQGPAGQATLRAIVQEVRARHRLQRQRHRRLLQGQPGDPDHVRAAQVDVHQAEHRLRDHLRQRLQPRR